MFINLNVTIMGLKFYHISESKKKLKIPKASKDKQSTSSRREEPEKL